jgi:predicted ATP-grasp superfamily ATP-dependent carboligase
MDIMTNKWYFAQMLDRLQLPHPKTILLCSRDEMAALPDSCYESMFLKPPDSQDFCRRHGVKAFLIPDKIGALAKMAEVARNGYTGFPILMQEYIPGPPTNHYFVDGFVDSHRRICTLFARQRLRMFPPLFGNSTLMETVPLKRVEGAIDTIERILSDSNYRGIFSCEFKYDERDSRFKLLEVNARPWWYVEFATRCGVDVCKMSYRDALGLPVEPVTEYPIGRRCVYLHNDFTAYRSGQLGSLLSWVRSWRGADGTIFSWDDPGPGVASMFRNVRRIIRRTLTQ